MEVIKCAALISLLPVVAMAQGSCAKTPDAYQQLYEQYGEQRITAGLANNGAVFEMWGGIEADTWTLMVTGPDGVTCIIASGVGWKTETPTFGDPA